MTALALFPLVNESKRTAASHFVGDLAAVSLSSPGSSWSNPVVVFQAVISIYPESPASRDGKIVIECIGSSLSAETQYSMCTFDCRTVMNFHSQPPASDIKLNLLDLLVDLRKELCFDFKCQSLCKFTLRVLQLCGDRPIHGIVNE